MEKSIFDATQESNPLTDLGSEHPEMSRWRHIRKPAAFVAGCAALGAAYGAYRGATEPTSIQLGPNRASVHVTADETLTVNFAKDQYLTWPLDTVGFGADVTVGDLSVQENSQGNPNLDQVVSEYVQLFSANSEYLATDVRNKVIDNIEGTALLWGLLGSLGALSCLAMHYRTPTHTRDAAFEYFHALRKPAAKIALGTTLVAAPVVIIGSDTFTPPEKQAAALSNGAPTSPVFNGTFLENATIHGEYLKMAINTIAGPALEKIQSVNTYYENSARKFSEQFTERYGDSFDRGDATWAFVAADEHCNIGANKFWGSVIAHYMPDVAFLAGDQTNDGTEAEGVCVASEASALKGIPAVVSGGNHDSLQTAEQDRANNIRADFGSTTEVAGFRVFTETDPRLDSFGDETRKTDETDVEYALRIRRAVCKDKPDILLVHDPGLIYATVKQGCAKLAISGHLHQQNGPFYVQTLEGERSYQFVQGTSGGIKPATLALFYFKNEEPALSSLLKFDPETKELLGRIDITLNPDGTPEISDFIPVSRAQALPKTPQEYQGQID